MTYLIPIVLIIIFIIANGIFVAAEFAVVASNKHKLQDAVEEGNALASFLLTTLKDAPSKDRYIAIAQLGITLASIGLGMYGEKSVAGWLYGPLEHIPLVGHALAHTLGTIIAVALLTYLHVVIGEMIPKALALQMPERTALAVARPMQLFGTVFAPVVSLLNGIGLGLLRLLGIPAAGHDQHYSVLELEQLVEESYQEGEVDARQHEIIDNIFRFSERKVGQLMTPRTRVLAIAEDASAEDVITLMRQTGHSRFPVYQGTLDDVIGILHIKDFVKYHGQQSTMRLAEIVRNVPRVSENTTAQSLLETFKQQQVHMAIVSNEFGGTAGIVTLEDLIEEVVGDVRDEFDIADEKIEKLARDHYRVDGDMLLLDMREGYGIAITSDSSETIAGVVIDALGRVPALGDVVTVQGYRLEVLRCEGLQVQQIELRMLESS